MYINIFFFTENLIHFRYNFELEFNTSDWVSLMELPFHENKAISLIWIVGTFW